MTPLIAPPLSFSLLPSWSWHIVSQGEAFCRGLQWVAASEEPCGGTTGTCGAGELLQVRDWR